MNPISAPSDCASSPASAWVPLEHLAIIRVTGRDRAQFLHNFCTNEIRKRQSGEGCEAFVTDAKAHILAHAVFLIQTDAILVVTFGAHAAELIAHWERYCITEDVCFVDQSSESTGFALWGPAANERVSQWMASLSPSPWAHTECSLREFSFVLARFPFRSTPCFLVISAIPSQGPILAALSAAGIMQADMNAFDALRIADGLPQYGCDISQENLPQEVNRNDLAISFTKGCYLGQETVARIDALGHVNRLLVPLKVVCEPGLQLGDPLREQESDRQVGTIRSVARSSEKQTYLALAMVRRESAEPGTTLRCPTGVAEVLARR